MRNLSPYEESAMAMVNAFLAGEGSIDFPDEHGMCWAEPATGKVFRRFFIAMKLHSLAGWNKISAPYRERYGYCKTTPHYRDF